MSTMMAPSGPIDLVSMLDGHPYPMAAKDQVPEADPVQDLRATEQ